MRNQPSDNFRNKFWQIFSISLTQFHSALLSAVSESFSFDLTGFDQWLSNRDPEYDCNKCTYKGWSGYSMGMYIRAKFGNEADMMVSYLNKANFEEEFSCVPG